MQIRRCGTLSPDFSNSLQKIAAKIPLESCYKEDEGLYCLSDDVSNTVIWANKNHLLQMIEEEPQLFDMEKVKNATPNEIGLYYIPELYAQSPSSKPERSPLEPMKESLLPIH